MKKHDIFKAAAKHAGLQQAVAEIRVQQVAPEAALLAEGRKILEAGGINAQVNSFTEDSDWSVYCAAPHNPDEAHVSFSLHHYDHSDDEWSFTFDELARADEIAYWLDEQENRTKRRSKEAQVRRAEEEAARLREELNA